MNGGTGTPICDGNGQQVGTVFVSDEGPQGAQWQATVTCTGCNSFHFGDDDERPEAAQAKAMQQFEEWGSCGMCAKLARRGQKLTLLI